MPQISSILSNANTSIASAIAKLKFSATNLRSSNFVEAPKNLKEGIDELKRAIRAIRDVNSAYKNVKHSDETELGRQICTFLLKIDEELNFCLKGAIRAMRIVNTKRTGEIINHIETSLRASDDVQKNIIELTKLNIYINFFVRAGFGT